MQRARLCRSSSQRLSCSRETDGEQFRADLTVLPIRGTMPRFSAPGRISWLTDGLCLMHDCGSHRILGNAAGHTPRFRSRRPGSKCHREPWVRGPQDGRPPQHGDAVPRYCAPRGHGRIPGALAPAHHADLAMSERVGSGREGPPTGVAGLCRPRMASFLSFGTAFSRLGQEQRSFFYGDT